MLSQPSVLKYKTYMAQGLAYSELASIYIKVFKLALSIQKLSISYMK